MTGVLQRLLSELDATKLQFLPFHAQTKLITVPKSLTIAFPPDSITHEYLWPRLSAFLQPHDILLIETGTPSLGIWSTPFPSPLTAISQTLWASIGYSLPATLGAALAARDLSNASTSPSSPQRQRQRTILFIGDGSFQVSAPALSTIIAKQLDVIVFLINNDGYTMERWVHGMDAAYNDVPAWRYGDVVGAFGGSGEAGETKTYEVRTRGELEGLLADEGLSAGRGLHFVDMRMPKEDAPVALRLLCAPAEGVDVRGGN
jgi:pyruvate decarboxylase